MHSFSQRKSHDLSNQIPRRRARQRLRHLGTVFHFRPVLFRGLDGRRSGPLALNAAAMIESHKAAPSNRKCPPATASAAPAKTSKPKATTKVVTATMKRRARKPIPAATR